MKSFLVKLCVVVLFVCSILSMGLLTACNSEKMYEELEVAISNESTDLGDNKTV